MLRGSRRPLSCMYFLQLRYSPHNHSSVIKPQECALMHRYHVMLRFTKCGPGTSALSIALWEMSIFSPHPDLLGQTQAVGPTLGFWGVPTSLGTPRSSIEPLSQV